MLNENPTDKKSFQFMTLKEMAAKFGCHPDTLRKYIQRLKDRIPEYNEEDRYYSPKQYKFLAEHYGFDI